MSTPEGVVAHMDVGVLSSEFTVFEPDGEVMCRGRIPFGAFGHRWEVVDGRGTPVLELRVNWWLSGATVTFAEGRECEVQGEFLRRTWQMLDADATVLRSVPTTSAWGPRPYSWLVEQDGSLTLTQFVAAVQTYRRAVQRRRGSAAVANS